MWQLSDAGWRFGGRWIVCLTGETMEEGVPYRAGEDCFLLVRWSREMAVYGCVTAPAIALLIAVGHLRLDVHGRTAVMLSEVIWFVGIGVGLWREEIAGMGIA